MAFRAAALSGGAHESRVWPLLVTGPGTGPDLLACPGTARSETLPGHAFRIKGTCRVVSTLQGGRPVSPVGRRSWGGRPVLFVGRPLRRAGQSGDAGDAGGLRCCTSNRAFWAGPIVTCGLRGALGWPPRPGHLRLRLREERGCRSAVVRVLATRGPVRPRQAPRGRATMSPAGAASWQARSLDLVVRAGRGLGTPVQLRPGRG